MVHLRKARADLTITAQTVTKRYHSPARAANEIHWYRTLPFGCPQLIDADPDTGTLVIAYHPPATHRPTTELLDLLRELEALHVHHRDVHPGNIVAGPDGPLLIDWETAILADCPSYDLYGPAVSGLPVPDIHTALRSKSSPNGYVMWVGADHRMSIRNQWRADAPLSRAP